MSRYIWLTNAAQDDVKQVMHELNDSYKPRPTLVVSEPMKSSVYTTAQLKKMGIVGIYERKCHADR